VLSLTIRAALASARDEREVDLDLCALIGRRAWLLCVDQDRLPGEGVRFIVVEGGDTPEVINESLGFPITGDNPDEPSFEWIEDHGLWFEIAYTRSDGLRIFIFVENGPGTELGLHYMCLAHFWPHGEGSGH
jgi:hypothetical protein